MQFNNDINMYDNFSFYFLLFFMIDKVFESVFRHSDFDGLTYFEVP